MRRHLQVPSFPPNPTREIAALREDICFFRLDFDIGEVELMYYSYIVGNSLLLSVPSYHEVVVYLGDYAFLELVLQYFT